jgi:hypothetical protein
VLGLGPHADVHMRVGLVVVQHHHVLVVGQFDLRELARRALHGQRVGAARHRQHDVEGLAPLTGFSDVVDQRAAEAPVIGQVVQRVLASHGLSTLVLDVEPAVLADVAEVGSDGLHAAPAARHLDHHLRRAADHGRFDALADGGGALACPAGFQLRLRLHLDDAVAWVEEPVAPRDQNAVDIRCLCHGSLLELSRSKIGRPLKSRYEGAGRPARLRPGPGGFARQSPGCPASAGTPGPGGTHRGAAAWSGGGDCG